MKTAPGRSRGAAQRKRPVDQLTGLPRQPKPDSSTTWSAESPIPAAYRLAWCPQNTSSPPPARTTRSLPAAPQRSQRSVISAATVMVGFDTKLRVIMHPLGLGGHHAATGG